jgi:hypothetical protein
LCSPITVETKTHSVQNAYQNQSTKINSKPIELLIATFSVYRMQWLNKPSWPRRQGFVSGNEVHSTAVRPTLSVGRL